MNPRSSSRELESRIVDPICDQEWDRLVISHPDFSFFHCAAWAKVMCKTYGHKPVSLYCARRDESLALAPLLEVQSPLTGRRGVCLPFTDSCAPLLFDQDYSSILFEKIRQLAQERNWKYFELRGGMTPNASERHSVAYYGHTLDLRAGSASLFAGLSSSARRAIRKARRGDLNVQVLQSEEAIREFYRLHGRTRRRHGLPPQPKSFFLNIHREVIKPGLGFVVLASKGTRTIAAAVFFHLGKKAVYKFGASDERSQDLRGNSLVMWNAIEFLAHKGFETLHLGRTSMENEGLRRFKLAWGTKEELIEYFRFDTRVNEWIAARDNVSGLHNAVFARLPLAVNRLMGAMIYPHLD